METEANSFVPLEVHLAERYYNTEFSARGHLDSVPLTHALLWSNMQVQVFDLAEAHPHPNPLPSRGTE